MSEKNELYIISVYLKFMQRNIGNQHKLNFNVYIYFKDVKDTNPGSLPQYTIYILFNKCFSKLI